MEKPTLLSIPTLEGRKRRDSGARGVRGAAIRKLGISGGPLWPVVGLHWIGV